MRRSLLATLFLSGVLASATAAFAGPPLLCHPYDIGSARSLPWGSGWSQPDPSYTPAHLVSDTDALLTPSTPVIVRMETLRRASLYASRDPEIARALLAHVLAKTKPAAGVKSADPLALLDAAYVAEALKQAAQVHERDEFRDVAPKIKAIVQDVDGVALAARGVAARPDDPAFEFAAALITSMRDKAAYASYAQRARAGAAQDPLLARNLGHLN